MNDLGGRHNIFRVKMTAKHVAGKFIRELTDEISGGCLIAEVGRGDDAHVPDADETIEFGDGSRFPGIPPG